MQFDVFLIANASNQPGFLAREQLFALLEHVRMTDVEGVKNTICIETQDLLLHHTLIYTLNIKD
jgi:hypothetical protein